LFRQGLVFAVLFFWYCTRSTAILQLLFLIIERAVERKRQSLLHSCYHAVTFCLALRYRMVTVALQGLAK